MATPSLSPEHRTLRRMWLIFGIIVVVIILIASIVILFVSAKLQQGLLSQAPNYDSQQLYSRGVEQVDKGDYPSAESYIEESLLKQDDNSYRSQLAVVKYRLKKYSEAIDQYQKLIAAGKDVSFAWNGVGNAYRDWAATDTSQQAAREASAIDAYQKAITLNPQYVAAYSNLALLYQSQGNLSEAAKVLDAGVAATGRTELSDMKKNIAK
jgi:tetratricopeptide (TPR) repeat protein